MYSVLIIVFIQEEFSKGWFVVVDVIGILRYSFLVFFDFSCSFGRLCFGRVRGFYFLFVILRACSVFFLKQQVFVYFVFMCSQEIKRVLELYVKGLVFCFLVGGVFQMVFRMVFRGFLVFRQMVYLCEQSCLQG